MTKRSVTKRSIAVDGHKTSVTIEDTFWNGLKEIAHFQRVKVPDLIAAIDAKRNKNNLSSAIRVFVLEHFRTKQAHVKTPASESHT